MADQIDKLIEAGLIVFGGQVSNQPINRNFFEKRADNTTQPPDNFWAGLEEIFSNLAVGREENTIDNFISPVFEKLGFNNAIRLRNTGVREERPDLIFFNSRENCEAGSSGDSVEGIYCIVEAKPHYANLDQHQKQLRDYLDKYYARSENAIKWGILTNGYEWRLYRYGKTGYLGFKLKDIVTGENDETNIEARKTAAKLFYNYFRREAFENRAAFLNEIERAAQEAQEKVKEELHKQAYPALLAIFNGYWRETRKNGSRPTRAEAYEDAIYFVYRLIFLLFSKGKELDFFVNLPEEVKKIFGEELKGAPVEIDEREIVFGESNKEFSIHASSFFESKLYDIFKWVNEGNPDLGVPQYNGGLFRKRRIDEERIDDYSIATALKLLLFSPSGETLDYGSLDVQHLGNIYERLLLFDEPKTGASFDFCYKGKVGSGKNIELKFPAEWTFFDVEPTKRKNTGTYYTPDYIVQYIVSHTVGEKLSEIATIQNDAVVCLVEKPLAKILDLKILDPAMGSGHFLIRAIDYVANFIVEHIGELEFHDNGNITCALGDITDTVSEIYGEWDDREKITRDLTGEGNERFWARLIAKRNIYGVDINPFAVELAKLAIWLHTFNEKEPLQFLDHHLKKGNSLIGYFDLGDAVLGSDRLREFKEAVKDMAAIGMHRDTDMAEVHASEELFKSAVERLLPFQNRIDTALSARHFMEFDRSGADLDELINRIETLAFDAGIPVVEPEEPETAPAPEPTPTIFDPPREERPKDKPNGDEKRHVKTALKIAEEKLFFHWKLEFPEVWFKTDLSAGDPELENGGFDVVIGNPPYVRAEEIGDIKEKLSALYECYQGTADLYTYFIERGLKNLNKDGVFSYIVSNKWMRSNYGESLRKYLVDFNIEKIIDFGELPVFQDAATFPMIIVISKSGEGKTWFAPIKRLDFESLNEEVLKNRYPVEKKSMDVTGYTLVPINVQNILDKMKTAGTPLGEYVEGKIYRGILTGFNEAFIIDKAKRDVLIAEDPKSAEIIKPFVVGDDVRKYSIKFRDRYLILTKIGVDIERYPAIFKHLSKYQDKLEKRWDKGNHWWELRNCAYYEEFEKPKIVFRDISLRGDFYFDKNNIYCVNTLYIMPGANNFLLGILNSKLITFYYSKFAPSYLGGYFRWIYQYVVDIPIPQIDHSNPEDVKLHDELAHLAGRMTDFARRRYILDEWDKGNVTGGSVEEGEVMDILAESGRELNHRDVRAARDENAARFDATDALIDAIVYRLYGLTPEEIAIVEGYFEGGE